MSPAPSDAIISNPSCEMMVTTRCNMQCTYCIAMDLPKYDMTKEIGISAIDYFIYLSEGAEVLDFIFTGGEPLLNYPKLKELIEYSVAKTNEKGMGAKISIKTNGTLIKKEYVEVFKRYKSTLFISIDGREADHNKYRVLQTEKSYKQVVENMKLLCDNEINCIASMTVHPDSAKYLLDGFKKIISYGFSKINIAPVYGTIKWSNSDIDDFINSMIDVARLIKKEKIENHNIDVGPIYKDTEHIDCKLKGIWGCNAGSSNIAILPNGDISGCSSLAMISNKRPELLIGNVISGIKQIEVDKLIELAKADCSCRVKCESCSTKDNCYGGCLAINYSTTGSVFDSPPIYCKTIAGIQKAWDIAWGEVNV